MNQSTRPKRRVSSQEGTWRSAVTSTGALSHCMYNSLAACWSPPSIKVIRALGRVVSCTPSALGTNYYSRLNCSLQRASIISPRRCIIFRISLPATADVAPRHSQSHSSPACLVVSTRLQQRELPDDVLTYLHTYIPDCLTWMTNHS